jgi:hypothetical protein
MALEQNILAEDNFFLGCDYELRCAIYQRDGVTPQDIAGWALSWMVKKRKGDSDAEALIEKTTAPGAGITITGVYNADPAVNTQRAVVAVADTDTGGSPPLDKGYYRHELKRTDEGAETILIEGSLYLKQAVHRA